MLEFIPQSPGLLPQWLLFISGVAIFNTVQTYRDPALTKKVYSALPNQVSPLSCRTFGTWTLISSIIRFYAAYNIQNKAVFDLAIASYVVALWHFASEWLWFGGCKFDKGLFGPLIVSTTSITWMLLTRDWYTA
ncbi:Erg28 protein [Martiniozyma asiatica (nom. inval.)]|nr:Erg28 protein [Martiniozyma asiatica]